MGLDISISRVERKACPHCGKDIEGKVIATEGSGGREWFEWLEGIGYCLPIEKRTEENDWYGKDMTLTEEQTESLYKFLGLYNPYNADAVAGLVARAILEEDYVVINADW